MRYQRCTVCGGWDFSDWHQCKPVWECRGNWEDWPGAEWFDARGRDAEEAAERYAEEYDCDGGEYALVSGRHRDPLIYVRKALDDAFIGPILAEVFAIEAESVPTYHARKVRPK